MFKFTKCNKVCSILSNIFDLHSVIESLSINSKISTSHSEIIIYPDISTCGYSRTKISFDRRTEF